MGINGGYIDTVEVEEEGRRIRDWLGLLMRKLWEEKQGRVYYVLLNRRRSSMMNFNYLAKGITTAAVDSPSSSKGKGCRGVRDRREQLLVIYTLGSIM